MRLFITSPGDVDQSDDPGLSEKGRFQARLLWHAIDDPKRVISGPDRLSVETAKLLDDDAYLVSKERLEELRASSDPVGGIERIIPIVRRELEAHEDVVLIAHRSLATAVLGALLDIPPEARDRFRMDPATITELDSDGARFRLERFNAYPMQAKPWYKHSEGFVIGSRRSERDVVLSLAKHEDTYCFLEGLSDVLGLETELEDEASYLARSDDIEVHEGDARLVIMIGVSRVFLSITGANEELDRFLADHVSFIRHDR